MFRRYVFGFAAVVALAAASLLLLPETSYAQRRGGVGVGRGGGWGGGWGGYRGGYSPGWGGGLYIGSYPRYSGYGYGYPYGYSSFYSPSYYSSSYYYPSYSYSYAPGYSYYTPSYASAYAQPSYGLGTTTQSTQSFYPPDDSRSYNTVHFRVKVPSPDAEIWFEGAPTQQRGMARDFESPELTPGRDYTYHIRARWMDNGQMRDETRVLKVQAGQSLTVDFNRPDTSATAPETPAANPGRPAAQPVPNQPLDQQPQTAPTNPPPPAGEIGPTGRVLNPPPAPPK